MYGSVREHCAGWRFLLLRGRKIFLAQTASWAYSFVQPGTRYGKSREPVPNRRMPDAEDHRRRLRSAAVRGAPAADCKHQVLFRTAQQDAGPVRECEVDAMKPPRFAGISLCAALLVRIRRALPQATAPYADPILHDGKVLTAEANFSAVEAAAFPAIRLPHRSQSSGAPAGRAEHFGD